MEKIFGIDLGTTNSEISYLNDGNPEIIEVTDGKKYLPSVVGTNSEGEIVTGFAARNLYAAYPENVVVSIKRKMGSGEKVTMAGKEFSPAQVSSHILRALKIAAERATGMSVNKVVITVPAYFNDAQRSDTMLAGELADLEVVRIINEPTAAALAYGNHPKKREKLLVYDLGGGTFDVSLIDAEERVIEVIATDGDTQLGGDDFDDLLVQMLASHLPDEVDPTNDLRLLARLRNVAESTKIALSTQTTFDLKESSVTAANGKPVNLELLVSRRDFETRIDETLDKTFALVRGVLDEKRLKSRDISKILLVGGSTYIPKVFNTLNQEFDCEVHRGLDPTYCVSIGAAIQGAIISGEEIDAILVDVNSHSLGIRCANARALGVLDFDAYSAIIHRNTPIPASMSNTYYTMYDGQESVLIEVFQGEETRASKNSFVGSFTLENLPKKNPAGSEVDVSFKYNINGVVEITASERKSGENEAISIDVNRISDADEAAKRIAEDSNDLGEFSREDSVEFDEKKIKRLVRRANKSIEQIDDETDRSELIELAEKLERALEANDSSVIELSDKLAEMLAGL